MVDSTLQVEFQEVCSASGGDAEIRIELDEVANAGKTSFAPGETAFVRVIRNPLDPYSMLSNGTVNSYGTSVPLSVVQEAVQFAYAREATLSYIPIPSTYLGVDWQANPPAEEPSLVADQLLTGAEIVGYGTVDYTTLFDKWRVTSSVGAQIVVVAKMGDSLGSLLIDFSGAEDELVDLDFKVVDYCDDTVVEGAQVHLDGVFKGLTNAAGLVNLGPLLRGSTHTVKIIKTDYIDSDLDSLRNDEFTVPES